MERFGRNLSTVTSHLVFARTRTLFVGNLRPMPATLSSRFSTHLGSADRRLGFNSAHGGYTVAKLAPPHIDRTANLVSFAGPRGS